MIQEQQHSNSTRTHNRMLRLPDVINAVGLSKASIYRLMHADEFPKAKRLSDRARAWRSDEIQEWIDSRVASTF